MFQSVTRIKSTTPVLKIYKPIPIYHTTIRYPNSSQELQPLHQPQQLQLQQIQQLHLDLSNVDITK